MAGPGSAARAIRRLMQVGDVVRQSYARRLGLGRSDYLALAHIYCEGPIQPRELGTRLGMGSGTLTPLLDRLERSGYALRTGHPMDRRRLLIVMSPQGLAAMDEASAEFDGIVGAALDEIGAAVGSGEFPALLEQLSGVLAVRLALDPACSDGVSAEAGPAGPAAEETVAGGMEDAVLAAPAAAGTEPPALDPCP